MSIHEVLTVDDLMRILRECAGDGEPVAAGDNVLDVTFEALGYDSLALLETAAQIDTAYGIEIDDETISNVRTPRALLEIVNRA